MTNQELNNLSLSELRELNKKVVEMMRLKQSVAARLNADALCIGMTVRYSGGSEKIKDEQFKVEKINRTNAVCKSLVTGTSWNINLANIEPIGEVIENYEPETFQK